MSILWTTLTIILILFTLPGIVELLCLTVAALFPSKKTQAHIAPSNKTKTIVVVPAHNEETSIARTLDSIKKCHGNFDIVVIADNCTDKTGSIATNLGIRAFIRNDPNKRGKNFALNYAFERLLSEGYDYFIVVDADSIVEANLVTTIQTSFANGADAVQVRYGVLNPNQSIRTRLMNIALMAFNFLRPKGRFRLGFSAGILGNGFALNRKVLLNVPYNTNSIVEDLAYHLRLVEKGYTVWFNGDSSVCAEFPLTSQGSNSQRARWEGGRFRLILDESPKLLRGILSGNWLLIEPLLDLLLLPLAYECLLLIMLLLLPNIYGKVFALFSLGVIAFHLLASIRIGGGGWRDVGALCLSPLYVLWKAAMLLKIIKASKKDYQWIRTERVEKDIHKEN